MQIKLDAANPFGPHRKTYKTVARATDRAHALLAQVNPESYPKVNATVIVTPVGDRFAPVLVFQGDDRVQAAVHMAHFTGFRCYA